MIANESGNQHAGNQVDDHLDGPGRVIGHVHVPHAEYLEDQRQEEWIAGQPDERQVVGLIQRIGMMDQQVFGDGPVDGAVSVELRIDQNEEQAQRGARQQSQGNAPVGQSGPGNRLAEERVCVLPHFAGPGALCCLRLLVCKTG